MKRLIQYVMTMASLIWVTTATAMTHTLMWMRRAYWGMGARPLLAGPEVRIRFTTVLPAGFPAAP